MKSLEQIYEDMLAVFQTETGYAMEDSADLAVRLKAAASEVFSLYVYANWIGKMAFPQTAEGQYLDYFAQMRGLHRQILHRQSSEPRPDHTCGNSMLYSGTGGVCDH